MPLSDEFVPSHNPPTAVERTCLRRSDIVVRSSSTGRFAIHGAGPRLEAKSDGVLAAALAKISQGNFSEKPEAEHYQYGANGDRDYRCSFPRPGFGVREPEFNRRKTARLTSLSTRERCVCGSQCQVEGLTSRGHRGTTCLTHGRRCRGAPTCGLDHWGVGNGPEK